MWCLCGSWWCYKDGNIIHVRIRDVFNNSTTRMQKTMLVYAECKNGQWPFDRRCSWGSLRGLILTPIFTNRGCAVLVALVWLFSSVCLIFTRSAHRGCTACEIDLMLTLMFTFTKVKLKHMTFTQSPKKMCINRATISWKYFSYFVRPSHSLVNLLGFVSFPTHMPLNLTILSHRQIIILIVKSSNPKILRSRNPHHSHQNKTL